MLPGWEGGLGWHGYCYRIAGRKHLGIHSERWWDMARRDALLRLHKSLVARRTELRKRLGGELNDLQNFKGTASTGDTADLAFDAGNEEVTSQLAELEAR